MPHVQPLGITQDPSAGLPQPRAFGLRIPDPHAARLTQKVLCFALVAALLTTAIFALISAVDAPTGSAVFWVLWLGVPWLVPLCGYFGVRSSNKEFLCVFGGFSLLYGIVMVGLLVALHVVLGMAHTIVEHCDPRHPGDDCPDDADLVALCENLGIDHESLLECYDSFVRRVATWDTMYRLVLVVGVPLTAVRFLTFRWGLKLQSLLHHGGAIHMPLTRGGSSAEAHGAAPPGAGRG
mmetsp:Transcript_106872/g.299267  ORF Transcript_106872/g.299267 Transcript_106872/m.299267 type:complete len:237 (+) Transcript_106872:105-815(+)